MYARWVVSGVRQGKARQGKPPFPRACRVIRKSNSKCGQHSISYREPFILSLLHLSYLGMLGISPVTRHLHAYLHTEHLTNLAVLTYLPNLTSSDISAAI